MEIAQNGEEGLQKAGALHPHLILLDIIMPKMDGLTMLKKLRMMDEWGRKVSVIVLTNISPSDEDLNHQVTEAEPSYYLVKADWAINDIVAKIRECLEQVASTGD